MRVLASGLCATQYAAGGRRRQIYYGRQRDGDVDRTHWLRVFAGRLFWLGGIWRMDGYDFGLVFPYSAFSAALPRTQMGAYVVGDDNLMKLMALATWPFGSTVISQNDIKNMVHSMEDRIVR